MEVGADLPLAHLWTKRWSAGCHAAAAFDVLCTEAAAALRWLTAVEGVRSDVPRMVEERGHTSSRRAVHAGPLSAVLDGSFLRYIRVGDQEVLRGIYVAFRDRNWGTIEPRFVTYQLDQGAESFVARFTAEHIADEVDYVWDGVLRGDPDGTLTYSMDGLVRRTVLRNRIGFCILHGMDFAGVSVQLETPHGPSQGLFPERISPHQPMFDIQAMRYRIGGVDTALRFEGDLFEMEDQRNWTDASYKTYCTPLGLPLPVEVVAGTRIRQSVTLSVHRAPAPSPGSSRASTQVWIGSDPVGTLPPLGLSAASHGQALSATDTEHLRALHLAHVRAPLDLLQPDWSARLDAASEQARGLGVELELEVITDAAGHALDELVHKLVTDQPPLARVLVFDRATSVTTRAALERLRALARASGLAVPLGGGSRTHFTEFNRASLPLDLFDVAGYPITPQVHAFDDASIVETLAAQPVTVASAQYIAGDLPLSIGPITLKPRSDSVADPRQTSWLVAAWTVGSLQGLSAAGVRWLTYYETTGASGVLDTPTTYPVYSVFAAIADLSAPHVLPVRSADGLKVQALALRSGADVRLLVANVTDADQTVQLHMPPLAGARLRELDTTETTTLGEPTATLVVQLRPWGVTRIDAQLAD